jgi:hypothetical protein
LSITTPLAHFVAGALLARCDRVIDRVLPAFPAGLSEEAIDAVLEHRTPDGSHHGRRRYSKQFGMVNDR